MLPVKTGLVIQHSLPLFPKFHHLCGDTDIVPTFRRCLRGATEKEKARAHWGEERVHSGGGRRMRGRPAWLRAPLRPLLSSLPQRWLSLRSCGTLARGWILRIFSPNPPTQPWAGNRPRNPTTGDAPYFQARAPGPRWVPPPAPFGGPRRVRDAGGRAESVGRAGLSDVEPWCEAGPRV